jgi:hypothetical protein
MGNSSSCVQKETIYHKAQKLTNQVKKDQCDRIDALCLDTDLMDGAVAEITRRLLDTIDNESEDRIDLIFYHDTMVEDVWKAALRSRHTQIRNALVSHPSVDAVKFYFENMITVSLKLLMFDRIVALVSEKVMDAAARGESRVCIERPEDITLTQFLHVFHDRKFKEILGQLYVSVNNFIVYVSWK